MAREHGVEELLPYTSKKPEERIRTRVEHGLRVKGTGVGQQVKGQRHERQMIARYALKHLGREPLPALPSWLSTLEANPRHYRTEKKREAMLEMPNLIREWKKVGHRSGISRCLLANSSSRSANANGPTILNRGCRPDLLSMYIMYNSIYPIHQA
jgi:hypothetical protein